MLLASDPEVTISVSATTRPMRPGEVDGADYHFVDDPEFDRMIAANDFVEWAPVFGYRYGTPKAPVKAALRAGRDILFDIDWQGTQQLERRLHARGTDSDAIIADRMSRAAAEISHWPEYEYVLVNKDTDECLAQVRSIVAAERLKKVRQTSLVSFVRELTGPAH
jgi:guanylate kinase